jgi:putative ABC transport system substrate-binding protein
MISRRRFLATAGARLLAAPLAVEAQPGAKVPRIGWLGFGWVGHPAAVELTDAFRRGLREHGWIEGQNILIEERVAEGRAERFADLAAELVRLKVDVIVTSSAEPAILAAKRATTTIPIVMAISADPVGAGLVASLARPGGNVTGLSILGPEVAGKRRKSAGSHHSAVGAASRGRSDRVTPMRQAAQTCVAAPRRTSTRAPGRPAFLSSNPPSSSSSSA